MKRFLLFQGIGAYPSYSPDVTACGGWLDLAGAFDTLPEALSAKEAGVWWHIVDLESMSIVAKGA